MRLSYRGAQDCEGESAFVTAVKAQAKPFERAPRSAARVRSLEVEITRTDEGHTGVLRVREADGTKSERDVRATTCDEVFSALALVVAITIDTGPLPPKPPPIDEPPPELPAVRPRWTWAAIAEGGAFFAMAPGPSWGGALSLEMVPPLSGAPITVRLGAALATSPRADTSVGTADFLWIAGRLGVGLFSLSLGPLSVHPMLGVDAGIVRGTGSEIAIEREQVRPWFDVTLGARLELRVLPRLGVEAAGGVLIPITRDRWVFDSPEVVVHATPPIGGYATIGLRFILWQ